jgi:hypothetical protein
MASKMGFVIASKKRRELVPTGVGIQRSPKS